MTLTQTGGELMTPEAVQNLTSELAEKYGVEEDNVKVETIFTVSGEMTVEIPEGVSVEEVEDDLEKTIADKLGVPVQDVTVTVDPETGVATFTIKTDDSTKAVEIQENVKDEDFASDVNEESTSGVSVSDISVEEDIETEITISVDATDSTSDVAETTEEFVQKFKEDGYESKADVAFVTSKPSGAPVIPPTVSFPSFAPSFVGVVATFEITKEVEKPLTSTEIEQIKNEFVESFNVTDGEVSVKGKHFQFFLTTLVLNLMFFLE